jgi:hypothetical protein
LKTHIQPAYKKLNFKNTLGTGNEIEGIIKSPCKEELRP